MITRVFAVLDSKVGTFAQPFFAATTASALRSFGAAAMDPNSMLGKHPSDFTLYELGSFDDETGFFESPKPVPLGTAQAVLANLAPKE